VTRSGLLAEIEQPIFRDRGVSTAYAGQHDLRPVLVAGLGKRDAGEQVGSPGIDALCLGLLIDLCSLGIFASAVESIADAEQCGATLRGLGVTR